MLKSKAKATQTEIDLTRHATILILNARKLVLDYNDLALKHEQIPCPQMQLAFERSFENLALTIASKDELLELSYLISQEIKREDNEITSLRK
jgi:hypothetical protein